MNTLISLNSKIFFLSLEEYSQFSYQQRILFKLFHFLQILFSSIFNIFFHWYHLTIVFTLEHIQERSDSHENKNQIETDEFFCEIFCLVRG
jgi:hypothetical protein